MRNIIEGYKVTSAQSLGASFTSGVTSIKRLDNVGVFIDCASVTSNTGSFVVQVRMKDKDGVTTSNWGDLTLSSAPTLANAAAQFFVTLNQMPPCEMRVKFTPSAGSPDGQCDVWVSATQVGG